MTAALGREGDGWAPGFLVLSNCKTYSTQACSLKTIKGLDDGVVRHLALGKNNDGAVWRWGKGPHGLRKLRSTDPGFLSALLP